MSSKRLEDEAEKIFYQMVKMPPRRTIEGFWIQKKTYDELCKALETIENIGREARQNSRACRMGDIARAMIAALGVLHEQ